MSALTFARSPTFSSSETAFVNKPDLNFIGSIRGALTRLLLASTPVVCFPKVGTATRALQKRSPPPPHSLFPQ